MNIMGYNSLSLLAERIIIYPNNNILKTTKREISPNLPLLMEF